MASAQYRTVDVEIETIGHRISGSLTLPAEGYRSRLTDFLNAREVDFIPLTSATVTPRDGTPTREHEFLAVAVRHVVLAAEIDVT